MMETRARRRCRPRRRGASLVEFALTAPLFFFFLCGAVEVSRMNMIRHTMHNAAYEGARRSIVPGATADDVRQASDIVLRAVGTHGAVVKVEPSVIQHDTPQVTVSIQAPVGQNGWIAPLFFRGNILTGSCTLAREKYQTVSVP